MRRMQGLQLRCGQSRIVRSCSRSSPPRWVWRIVLPLIAKCKNGPMYPRLLAHTMDGIIRSDRIFTMPGVIGVIATGIAAAIYGDYPILRTGWILWTLILFVVSGLIFMIR